MEALTHLWIVPAVMSLLLVFACYLAFHPAPFQRKTEGRCPTTLWTYLHAKPTPQQTTCIHSWKEHHPTWTIHVMTPETVRGFLHQLPYPHEAPIFRDPECWQEIIALTTLEEHGGIWLDPDTLIRAPLTDFLPDSKEFAAFQYTLPSCPVSPLPSRGLSNPPLPPSILDRNPPPSTSPPFLDKRIIASIPRHPMVSQWRSEYLRIMAYPSVEAYLQSLPALLAPYLHFSYPVDWVMSLTLQHALLVKPYPMESLHLLSIDKSQSGGPLQHLVEAKGDIKKAEPIALNSKEPIVFLGVLGGL